MLKTIWDWLVKSSQDPAKFSLTIKAGIPFLVALLQIFGKPVDTAVLGELGEQFANVVILGVAFISGVITLWGASRKVGTTLGKMMK